MLGLLGAKGELMDGIALRRACSNEVSMSFLLWFDLISTGLLAAFWAGLELGWRTGSPEAP
jgi:hypothetical protein